MRKRLRPSTPVPLLEWVPPLGRQSRIDSRSIFLLIGIGASLMTATAMLDYWIRPAPRLVWNASASAPTGLWRITPDVPLGRGDMVLARTPASVRQLAATRRYIPANVPLLKRIAARNGDDVCSLGDRIYVNGDPVAKRLHHDRAGRILPRWEGCELLRGGRLLLMMDRPDSFDSRYFGPVDSDAIIGKATPLWLR
ncbi:S26 family signal peptidase [Sphingobium yanoikuyae]|jgi:conjugative transfer signal peptidase TraF|uniref:S26 family signal peptidase n=1 Tax=Sphingobium yanoikuyae TaxID=13690 RepID=UPI003B90DC84